MHQLILFLSILCLPFSVLADTKVLMSALSDLNNHIQMRTLSNGLRVIMYKRGTAPVFSGVISVGVGGVNEALGETGISHMLEHMAFKGTDLIGTKDYSKEQGLLQELERIVTASQGGENLSAEQKARWEEIHKELKEIWINGAFLHEYELRGGSDLNAQTGKDSTDYFISLPKPSFEYWCWAESERVLNPVMRQFYQERDVVMEERFMRFENSPPGKLYEMLLGTAFAVHPYRNPVIGYDFDIKKLTATRTDEFRRQYYVAPNMVVALVGDIDPDRDIVTVERYLGRIPTGSPPSRPTVNEPAQNGQKEIRLVADASPEVMITYRKPSYPDPDDPPISVMLEILAGGRVSPMFEDLVKRRQIAADIGYEETPGNLYPNLFVFSATVKSPYSNDQFVRAFDEVVKRFKKSGATEEALNIAKRNLAVNYLASFNSNITLAQQLAQAELAYKKGWRSIMNWFSEAMNVTQEDIKRVANQYLNNDYRTIARVEPRKSN